MSLIFTLSKFFPSSQLTARSLLTRHLWELLVTEHVLFVGNQHCTGISHVETPDVQKVDKSGSTHQILIQWIVIYPVASAIQRLNNCGQICFRSLQLLRE